ncbi:hypothetical protein ABZ702_16075 [Streptomyces cyaneofuscatus]|uniref:hypothetical protein n=1 Tax=Streptomyces cyaneofuscatus TaxID=66883 RepID=UPI0033E74E23
MSGSPLWLPPTGRVLLVAARCRADLTMRRLAPSSVLPAIVCRAVQRLRPSHAPVHRLRTGRSVRRTVAEPHTWRLPPGDV